MEFQIKKVEKMNIQVQNKDVQDVSFEVLNAKGKVVAERRMNFPLDESDDSIISILTEVTKGIEAEYEARELDKKREEENSNLEKNAKKLIGKKVKIPEKKS